MGHKFLACCEIAAHELVDSAGVYHSSAKVIEGVNQCQCMNYLVESSMCDSTHRSSCQDKYVHAGEFWLTSRKAFQLEEHNRRQDDPEKLIFFCEKGWDRKSGQRICVSRHKMKSGKQFIR